MSAPRRREAADPVDDLIACEQQLSAIRDIRDKLLGLPDDDLAEIEQSLQAKLYGLTMRAARSL